MSSSALPSSALFAAGTDQGEGATPPSTTRTSWALPFWIFAAAATDTSAKLQALRSIALRNVPRRSSAASEIRTDVMSSPFLIECSLRCRPLGVTKSWPSFTVRRPMLEAISISASYAMSAGARSDGATITHSAAPRIA